MRHFSRLSAGKSLDSDINIRCEVTGFVEPYESLGMYSSINHLVNNDDPRAQRSFWIMKPFRTRIKKWVKSIENVLGGVEGCPIREVLKLKAFCEFDDDDFSFLQYLATAVVNMEAETVPFRSLLIAPRNEVEASVPRFEAVDYQPGMVLLGDSREQFL